MKRPKLKPVKPKKKKPLRYVPVNENKEYEKIILILKRDILKELVRTITTPLS